MADSARMRRGEPVSAAELAPVEGSSDLVPQEHMSQAQLMQLIQSFGVASLMELSPEHYGNFATGLRGMGAQI